MKSIETLKSDRDLINQQLADDQLDLSTNKIVDLLNQAGQIDDAIEKLESIKPSVKKNSK